MSNGFVDSTRPSDPAASGEPVVPSDVPQPKTFLNSTWRAIKHILGVLLATISLGGILVIVASLIAPDPRIPWWGLGLIFVSVVGPTGIGAMALLWKTVTAPTKRCPQCGSRERVRAGVLHRLKVWPYLVFGLLAASLWGASREREFQCTHCETIYSSDTRSTRITGILLWVFILLTLLCLLADTG